MGTFESDMYKRAKRYLYAEFLKFLFGGCVIFLQPFFFSRGKFLLVCGGGRDGWRG